MTELYALKLTVLNKQLIMRLFASHNEADEALEEFISALHDMDDSVIYREDEFVVLYADDIIVLRVDIVTVTIEEIDTLLLAQASALLASIPDIIRYAQAEPPAPIVRKTFKRTRFDPRTGNTFSLN